MEISAWRVMREMISVAPDTTARKAVMKITSSGLPAMPVVDDNREVLGVVNEWVYYSHHKRDVLPHFL